MAEGAHHQKRHPGAVFLTSLLHVKTTNQALTARLEMIFCTAWWRHDQVCPITFQDLYKMVDGRNFELGQRVEEYQLDRRAILLTDRLSLRFFD